MKYTLINCYSDNNKGDLGIILSTIDFLNEVDDDAKIIGVSTYNYSDPYYGSEHKLLSREITIYPSIFGELNIGTKKGRLHKSIKFIFESVRILLFLILSPKLGLFLFDRYEKESIGKIIDSDYIISKGGSFLCNEDNLRSKIAYIRLCFIFLMLIKLKLNNKIVILCQSIGPVYGKFSKMLLNYILKKCQAVVLREDVCIAEYSYIKIPNNKRYVLNDIAFYLKSKYTDKIKFEVNSLKIGMTIKSVSPHLEVEYKSMMKAAIEYSIDKYNAFIYIYPHVTVDNDLEASYGVYKMLDDRYKKNVIIFSNDYESQELKYLYSQMDLFIGTRLHSTIFAMGEYIPSICIAYHGTKAQGIFKNLNSANYVVQNYVEVELLKSIDELYNNRIAQSLLLRKILILGKEDFINKFRLIFR